jgi:hypothetical protein
MEETMTGIDFTTVVAAVLAVLLLVDVSVLWLMGRQVPALLTELVFAVIGFYFGRAPGGKKKGGA